MVRAEQPELRVLPADQRLDAHDRRIAQAHERLVLHHQLAPLQRGRQARGQLEPGDLVRVPLRVEHRPAVPPVALGPVQRRVRGFHQVGRTRTPYRPLHDSHARRHGDLVAAQVHRRPYRRERRLGDVHERGGSLGTLDQDHELVAAHPGHQQPRPGERVVQPVGDGVQEFVPDVVAERVVDHLEPVDVEVAHADAGVGRGRFDQHLAEPLEEQCPVRQPGQRIVQRLMAQPGLEQVPLGDVGHHRHHEPRCAVAVPDERQHHVGPDQFTVAARVRPFQPQVAAFAVR